MIISHGKNFFKVRLGSKTKCMWIDISSFTQSWNDKTVVQMCVQTVLNILADGLFYSKLHVFRLDRFDVDRPKFMFFTKMITEMGDLKYNYENSKRPLKEYTNVCLIGAKIYQFG